MCHTAVSSANKGQWLFSTCGKSLMYSTKEIGPRAEPCGTPERTSFHEDLAPSSVGYSLLPALKK